MNRGDHREDIVQGLEDRELFVSTLAEACVKSGWCEKAPNTWCGSNSASLTDFTRPMPEANLIVSFRSGTASNLH